MQQKKRTINYDLQIPEIHIYNNPHLETKIVFSNRLNTDYDVIQEELLDIGLSKTYKDFLQEGFNPVINEPKNTYGVAKKMQPKTITINEMKTSIDNATATLNELTKQFKDAAAAAEQPKTEPSGGETSND